MKKSRTAAVSALVIASSFLALPLAGADNRNSNSPSPTEVSKDFKSAFGAARSGGLKEFEFYTVLFSMSRSLGIISQLVLSRAMGLPLTRPKSLTFEALNNL